MRPWTEISKKMPDEIGGHSKPVEVKLDNGVEDWDFTIGGKWTFYCAKSPDMPHVIAWREEPDE